VQEIKRSGARILFVGLGAPRQERWMAERKGEVDAVMFGVGAAFDFLAGAKR
jgi:N-acetylglucosaminyldiphosphoundecaprenol N-acetyl-beta-D-mannosaminyltransferase